MILALSSSSPVTSIALVGTRGEVLYAASRQWKNRAMEAFAGMLVDLPCDLSSIDAFLADLGPGSFTGTRVGVTLAKSLGYAHGKPCGGFSSFDFISKNQVVVFPSKRGEWFVRVPSQGVIRTEETIGELRDRFPEIVGFGPGVEPACYPAAENVRALLSEIVLMSPAELLPLYLIEPSISTPKNPIGYTMSSPNVPPVGKGH